MVQDVFSDAQYDASVAARRARTTLRPELGGAGLPRVALGAATRTRRRMAFGWCILLGCYDFNPLPTSGCFH